MMAGQSSRDPGWQGQFQVRDQQQVLLGPVVASDSLQEPGTPASPCFPLNTLWAWQSRGQVCGALVSALPEEALMIPSVSK